MRSIQEKKKDGYKGEAHCDSSKLREKEGGLFEGGALECEHASP